VDCLCEAGKRVKVHFSCISLLFGRLSKEVASTGYPSREPVRIETRS
jgi:hypothetical protein